MNIFSEPLAWIFLPLGLSLLGGYTGAILNRKRVIQRLAEWFFHHG